MNKLLLAALMIVVCVGNIGCSSSQYEIVDGKMIIEKRSFKAKERCDLEIKSDKPLLVGFSTDIPHDVASAMFDRARATGDSSKSRSARVKSTAGPWVGSLHGGAIEMPSEDGIIKFEFINLLNHDQEFTVYAKVD